jgi:hypothetical protein
MTNAGEKETTKSKGGAATTDDTKTFFSRLPCFQLELAFPFSPLFHSYL